MVRGRKEPEAFLWPTVSLHDEDSLIMATIRALAIFGFLVTFSSTASIAMPPEDVPSEVKLCKAITDDKERLKCFDRLFGEASKPQNPSGGAQANWSIEETKSPTDGSPQVVASNLVNDTVLILRCKDQITEAAFSTQHTLAIDPLT